MPKRTDLPDFLRDPAQNRFISGRLESTKVDGDGLDVAMTNTLIERAVEQIRSYFPEQYQGGDGGDGGNVVTPSWSAAS